jgi:NTE family protein
VLFHTGDDGDACFIVESGSLQVSTSIDGQELAVLAPGAVVGELALLLNEPRSATVTAIGDTKLLELRRDDFDALIAKHPALSVGLTRQLGRRIVNSNRLVAGRVGPRRSIVWPASMAGPVAEAIAARGHRVGIGILKGARAEVPGEVRRVAAPSFAHSDATLSTVIVAAPDEATPSLSRAAASTDHVLAFGSPPDWLVAAAPANRLVRLENTPLGLRRSVRWATGRAVGVVLSSGGSKAVAHLGVLTTLLDAGIEIDAVAGSSGGAVAAVAVAFGKDEAAGRKWLGDIAHATHWRRLDLNVPPRSGLSKGRKLRAAFAKWNIPENLEDADIPIWLVASDVATGRAVALHRGPVADAIRASMSVPGAFDPWRVNGNLLIDGAVVNPLPTDVLRAAGVGIVIASNVAGQTVTIDVDERVPGLGQIMGRMLNATERQVIRNLVPLADIVIRPIVNTSNTFDFSNIEGAVEAGEVAARERLDEVKALLRAASDKHLYGIDR